MWAVMKAFSWDSLTVLGNIPLVAPGGGPQRFLPVFDTREQAEAWADPGDLILELMEKKSHETAS